MPDDEECPKGGVHGWRYDSTLDGRVVMYCWKCSAEVITDADD